jgi:hypothetical protein
MERLWRLTKETLTAGTGNSRLRQDFSENRRTAFCSMGPHQETPASQAGLFSLRDNTTCDARTTAA